MLRLSRTTHRLSLVRRREPGTAHFVAGLIAAGSAVAAAPVVAGAAPADHVIQISVDGLRSGDPTRDLQTLIDAGRAPNFARLQREGAWTHNARTDTTYIYTLPNHTGMMTGRPADDANGPGSGHQYRYNTDPPEEPFPTANLHDNARVLSGGLTTYVASTFDVAHDNGLSTSLHHGKDKFVVFDNSYDADSGRRDTTGADNGPDKIDRYVFDTDTARLVGDLVARLNAPDRPTYSFLHLRNPDSAGHANGWGSTQYLAAVELVDGQLGNILNAVNGDAALAGRTTIILSADHGGGGAGATNHGNFASPLDYTVPFYAWGAGVTPAADLYALNAGNRADPETANVPYGPLGQPIRNSDGGNLALELLGLGAIPGSSVNAAQDLVVPEPSGFALVATSIGMWAGLGRRRRPARQR